MTGERENRGTCYYCRGELKEGKAAVPFLLKDSVIVVKEVPAEICKQCNEPYMAGEAVDKITALLDRFEPFHAEVIVVSYDEDQLGISEAAPKAVGVKSS